MPILDAAAAAESATAATTTTRVHGAWNHAVVTGDHAESRAAAGHPPASSATEPRGHRLQPAYCIRPTASRQFARSATTIERRSTRAGRPTTAAAATTGPATVTAAAAATTSSRGRWIRSGRRGGRSDDGRVAWNDGGGGGGRGERRPCDLSVDEEDSRSWCR